MSYYVGRIFTRSIHGPLIFGFGVAKKLNKIIHIVLQECIAPKYSRNINCHTFTQVSNLHAKITCKRGAFFVTDLRSEHGTYITDNEGRWYRIPPNFPTRLHPSDVIGLGSDEKVAFRVMVMKFPHKVSGKGYGISNLFPASKACWFLNNHLDFMILSFSIFMLTHTFTFEEKASICSH